MIALDAIILPSLSQWDLLGLELYFLEAIAGRNAPPILMVYSLAGRMVSLGRYHRYAGETAGSGIEAMRRLTGGRVVGAGEGWVGLAIVAPDARALLSARDANIKPEQVINRYARGILAGLRSLGMDCFYPGRDAITCKNREIAMCSFESDPAGAMIFEAALAVNRGMEEFVHDLDRFDPDGAIHSGMYGPDNASKIVRELDRDIDFHEISRAMVAGYASTFGLVRERELSPEERAHGARRGLSLSSTGWLQRGSRADSFNRVARTSGQIGSIDVRVATTAANIIERVMISGDFIANSSGMAELEAALAGRSFDADSILRAVAETYGEGRASARNYFVGLGDIANLSQLIAAAQ